MAADRAMFQSRERLDSPRQKSSGKVSFPVCVPIYISFVDALASGLASWNAAMVEPRQGHVKTLLVHDTVDGRHQPYAIVACRNINRTYPGPAAVLIGLNNTTYLR